MPQHNTTLGSDLGSLTITLPDGQILPVPREYLISFEWKQDTQTVKKSIIDNRNLEYIFPGGYDGSIQLLRFSDQIERFFIQMHQDIANSKVVTGFSLLRTLSEPNGSISQIQFTGVTLKLDDAGTMKGQDVTEQKISWHAVGATFL
jgi:hypothetical protein